MNTDQWLSDYFARYRQALFGTDVSAEIKAFRDLAEQAKANGAKIIFAGNGASAAIASHVSVDFTKQAGVRGLNFNEADLITCFSNDYGYEHWVEKAVEFYADPGDIVVLISSSGRSPNIVNAADAAKRMGLTLVTFSGFGADNSLRQRGDVNFWVDSRAYNVVECVHMIWITAVIDLIIGKAEYGVS